MSGAREKPIVINQALSNSEVLDVAYFMGGETSLRGGLHTLSVLRDVNELNPQREYFTIDLLNGKKFRAISRGDIGDDELVVALSRLPSKYQPFADEVRRVFHLPEFDAAHASIREAQDQRKAIQIKTVADAKARLPAIVSNDELPLESMPVKEVCQSAMKVLDENSKEQALVTEGVGPCLVVMFINPRNQRIGMAHIASANDIRLLEDMRERVQGDSQDRVEVKMWGGRPDHSEKLAAVLMDEIQKMKGLELASVDVCDPLRKAAMLNGIALSRNGEIRLTTSEKIRDITAPPPLGFELTDDHINGMLRSIRGIEPTSIKPDKEAMKRQGIGRGRGMKENSGDEGDS